MNSADVVISVLGDTGKKEWTRSEIIEVLSESLKIEKKEASSKFDTIHVRNDFFEKINDDPAKYKFSKSGQWRYDTLRKRIESNENFRRDLSVFISNYYWDKLIECVSDYKEFLEIDYADIEKGFPHAAELLLEEPSKTIIRLNEALQDIELPNPDDDYKPEVSIFNTGELLQVEDVKTEHIDKFVQVEGRVVVQTQVTSELIEGAYQCMRCEHIEYLPQGIRKRIEPYECANDVCGRKGPFKLLDPPESRYEDGQMITIESLKGEITLKIHLRKSLCRPQWERDGKVIRVCGVLKTNEIFGRNGTRLNVFEWVIEANNVRFADDSNTQPPTEDEKKLFDEWVKNPVELRKNLLESVAPHIYGMLEVKDICMLTLFSDWTWNTTNQDDVFGRSSIHVLLFGDPGVAKSQIVKDIIFLAPKGKFGQVPQMSKGGLSTAAVQQDGEWCVKSGFFNLADQGIAGLDEIDKIDRDDIKLLGSVLLDQVQKVSKAGKNDINFNTREAVLGTANPKTSHLMKEELYGQLAETIPSYILQRFDIIFILRDIPDKDRDKIIISSINKMYKENKTNRKTVERTVAPDLFRKYVLYARSKPVPDFAPAAQKLIEEHYLKIRGDSPDYPVIGPRQGENLNRISRALARREMAPVITEEHVKYAIGLMKAAHSTFSEGDDYSAYNYGRTKSQAERTRSIRDAIRETCKKEKSAKIEDISFITGLDSVRVEHDLILMEKNKEIYKLRDGYRVP